MSRNRRKDEAAQAGSKARRQRSKDELRQQILDAARDLFVAEGYDAVTMRKIAARIDYTPTTIYLHFKDKEALCDALCEQDWLAFGQVFGRLLTITHPVERLLRAGEAYINFGLRYPQQYRWLFMTPRAQTEAVSTSIQRGDPSVDAYAFLRQTVGQCIAGGFLREEFSAADYVAQLVWASVHGVVTLHAIRPGKDWIKWASPRRLARGQLQVIENAIVRDYKHTPRIQRTSAKRDRSSN